MGFRELAELLRRDISAGVYEPGSTLPKQDDLAVEHGVNVNTVRRAVALLEAEGLVTPVRRRGTVVRDRPPMRRVGTDRYARSRWKYGVVAFAVDREASGRAWAPGDQTQEVQLVEAADDVAEGLGVDPGSEVYERARVIRDAGKPTHTLTSWYRREDVEGTPLVDPTPGPAGSGGGFQVLTLQGLEPQRIRESLQARMPTPEERDQLDLPAGEPVVILTRVTYANGDRPVEFARGVHAATRFTWTYDFPIPD